MAGWWLAGTGVVAFLWMPLGDVGTAVTLVAGALFLFLVHGKYLLARSG